MKKTIKNLDDLQGKRVFLRLDLNVPLDENGNVTDDTRIAAAMPTIKYLLIKGAKIIICSHLGRPKGERKESMSLLPVAKALINYLPLTKIKFSYDCIGEKVEKMTHDLKNGEILMLENIRFYKEEEKNDIVFARRLARLADIYVTDAFGASHRHHASVEGVARLLPNAMGFLMGKEVNTLLKITEEAQKPFVAVLGGSKVADKIYVVMNLLKKADAILIGGGMAYTFLKAKGVEIGQSLVEEDKLDLAREILKEAEKYNKQIFLPIDHKCAPNFATNVKPQIVGGQDIPKHLIGMDIGPKTVKLYSKIISK
ncbi:MAG: phosphoglycerate kinase, partial [Clostridia bacterium]|nr:phosphoglycerate kinase [Clostridia bacterium]